ncbi:hypothetical protein ACS15_0406 [Ralstonia insidiosa]|uniref:Uncharacterized protein n=1 Tax=Ralstonia insidiosa TaxID=190721 RepID=A0AAC9BHP9_9RALS|nr:MULTISPECIES: hypothetical protein [Ralstonia]ANH74348.1 hypothetical protein ACS15_0406 [Ralstonia insidiosa]EPX95713.1 hypothetical protein C404_20645 [Ralstonia sp. AU12-08]MBY4707046.1 hypothetical protein [Ralstonia insidiosa]GAQ28109.1 hypothetical protein SAMD00023378_1792 [Ralstonia sp. NT80]
MGNLFVQRIRSGAVRVWRGLAATLKWLGGIAEPVSKWAATAASLTVVGGGIWAYYQFVLGGGTDWAINLSLSTEIVRYHDDLGLVVIHVHAKNPRMSEVTLEPTTDKYELRVRRLPLDRASGAAIDPDKDGELIRAIDMLPKEGYTFAPGADFDDAMSIVLPYGTAVTVTADLTYAGDNVSASKVVLIDGPDDAAPALQNASKTVVPTRKALNKPNQE